ncbi:AMP-binding enzyme [Paenibacillus pabuli]|uniref:AMP-binding enzyme n=2 Tax=Paenibacillus TaxID=44249 RepID=A0A855YFI7_9BACL|nr:AMP-binding enzyme [Paenibacillus pabuli]PXW10347.1 AMP-binding enzyme [Paenibacillus taichungensis]
MNQFNRFKKVFPDSNLFYSYGLSEAGPRVTFISAEEIINKGMSSGKPLDNIEIKIFREKGSKDTDPGEIMLKSPSLMLGYFNNEYLTKRKLINGWLATGDMGFIDTEGNLHVLGRKDEAFIRGGKLVYPSEIEHAIMQINEVKDCLVYGELTKNGSCNIYSLVTLDCGSRINVHDITGKLRGVLPLYLIPQKIKIVKVIPNNAGKSNRKKILEGGFFDNVKQ